jgi:hypothetical protein
VLHWDEDGTLGTDYLVRGAGVRLFLSIALPTTIITVATWAFMYGVGRRWARRHARELGLHGYGRREGVAIGCAPPFKSKCGRKIGNGVGNNVIMTSMRYRSSVDLKN